VEGRTPSVKSGKQTAWRTEGKESTDLSNESAISKRVNGVDFRRCGEPLEPSERAGHLIKVRCLETQTVSISRIAAFEKT
jgi:hypothetical protein